MGMPSICGTTIKIQEIPAWKTFRREPLCVAVATEVWAAYMDMLGSILGMEWWPITGAIFPWKVWKNGAVGRPQPVRDIRVDRLGVPRWSSGKLEQKERMKRMRTYRVMKSKKGDKMQ